MSAFDAETGGNGERESDEYEEVRKEKKRNTEKEKKGKSKDDGSLIDATLFTIKYPALDLLPGVGSAAPNQCFRSISIVQFVKD